MIFPDVTPVDVTPEEQIRFSGPQIVWPTMVTGERDFVEGDLNWFPDEYSYRERLKRGIGGAASRAFRDAVRLARHRLWLLDEQLLRHDASLDRLSELFFNTGAWDLRIVTASREGAEERANFLRGLQPDLQRRSTDSPTQLLIRLNFNSARDMPKVHDRFAIVDDVLWHCGATIGGLHDAINAMTYGWSAPDTKAVAFFERVCKILEDDDV